MIVPAKERTRVLVVAGIALFFSVLVWFNYSAVLPLVVEEWGLSGTQAGIVFGAFQAGYLVAIVPAGWLADRWSPRWVVAFGATGTRLPSLGFAVVADGFLVGTRYAFPRPERLLRRISDARCRCVPRTPLSWRAHLGSTVVLCAVLYNSWSNAVVHGEARSRLPVADSVSRHTVTCGSNPDRAVRTSKLQHPGPTTSVHEPLAGTRLSRM